MHKWAKQIMECVKAKVEAIGLDNFEGQNLDDLKDFTEIAKNIACFDKDYRIVEAMEKSEDNEDIMRMVEQYEESLKTQINALLFLLIQQQYKPSEINHQKRQQVGAINKP